MKNIFSKALLIASMTLFSVLPMAAQALGTSCENPFVITEEFSTTITEPGSYWFSVTTYDLPLRVRYTPNVATGETMKAYVDFSCTPGVYDDPNLYELTDMATGWGFEMPLPFGVRDVMVDGKLAYYEASVDESYRELMTNFGILYNVEAKVGSISELIGNNDLGAKGFKWDDRFSLKLKMIMGDPKTREDWKAHAKKQLEHVNPYTNLAWKDDPTFMGMEYWNEMDLMYVFPRIDKETFALADREFQNFLKEKYQTIENLNSTGRLTKKNFRSFEFIFECNLIKTFVVFLYQLSCGI